MIAFPIRAFIRTVSIWRGAVLSIALHGSLGLLLMLGLPALPALFDRDQNVRTVRAVVEPDPETSRAPDLPPRDDAYPATESAYGTAIDILFVPESSLPSPSRRRLGGRRRERGLAPQACPRRRPGR